MDNGKGNRRERKWKEREKLKRRKENGKWDKNGEYKQKKRVNPPVHFFVWWKRIKGNGLKGERNEREKRNYMCVFEKHLHSVYNSEASPCIYGMSEQAR